MTDHYRIGEFALLTGVSVKALRFYDEIGLLRPASVDARTGYRHYSATQFELLASIQELKSLGMRLSEIRNIVGRSLPAAERKNLLHRLRSEVQHSLRSAKESLRWIDAELNELRRSHRSIPVILKRRHAMRIASTRIRLRKYEEVVPFEEKLLASVPSQAVGRTHGVLWHSCADSGTLDAEPFIELKQAVPRHSFYDQRELAAAAVACSYSAFDQDAEPAYDSVRRWMHARGFLLAGAKREIYLGQLLEIQFPIAPA